ncbi:MAG: response regulator [Calditrichaeota bacterium]|nr:MAG: response regulator [Calditrichota bacterium]
MQEKESKPEEKSKTGEVSAAEEKPETNKQETDKPNGKDNGQSQSAPQHNQKPREVFVIEDDQVTRKMLEAILSQKGYHVITASNGREALSKVQSWSPEVCIADINMPIMSGIEFLREFRKKKEFLHVPIIFLTAQRDKHSVVRAASLGIDGYIGKPVNFDLLVKKINEVCQPRARAKRLENIKSTLINTILRLNAQKKKLQDELNQKSQHFSKVKEQEQKRLNQLMRQQGNDEAKKREISVMRQKMKKHQEDFNFYVQKMKKSIGKVQTEIDQYKSNLKSISEMLEQRSVKEPQ